MTVKAFNCLPPIGFQSHKICTTTCCKTRLAEWLARLISSLAAWLTAFETDSVVCCDRVDWVYFCVSPYPSVRPSIFQICLRCPPQRPNKIDKCFRYGSNTDKFSHVTAMLTKTMAEMTQRSNSKTKKAIKRVNGLN